MRKWLIELLHGFPDLDSAISYIKRTDDPRKQEILSEAVKRLYNAIGADDILQQNFDKSWSFQGRILTVEEMTQLTNEARELMGMKLWKVLNADIKYQLGKKMFEEARVKDDMVWGQLLTYLFDIIKTRLRKMQ